MKKNNNHISMIFISLIIFTSSIIYINIYSYYTNEVAKKVFLNLYNNSLDPIFVNQLIKNDKIIKRIREEEELGEIDINDDILIRKKDSLDYFRLLKLYSIGVDVEELNIALYYLGYGAEKDSRIYSPKTKRAVKKFQKYHGISIDGLAGKNTIKNINKIIKEKKIKIPDCEPELKKALSKKYWIVINKDTNILRLYKFKTLIKKYPVATGKELSDTPEGKFKIIRKTKDPYWGGGRDGEPIEGGDPRNPLGTRWLGLDYGDGRWYGIHGTTNPKSIGKYVSNGCVRMFNEDVEEVFRIVPGNTIVLIDRDKDLNKSIY